jgi:hypothetical protein
MSGLRLTRGACGYWLVLGWASKSGVDGGVGSAGCWAKDKPDAKGKPRHSSHEIRRIL